MAEPVSRLDLTAGAVSFFGAPAQKTDKGNAGPGHEMAKITPEYRAVKDYSPKDKNIQSLRELGFTAGAIAPSKGIIRGTSGFVVLADEDPNEVVQEK